MMYIGCHMSIRNGYDQAAKTAHALGANAFQYFPKNPRSISIKDFDKKAAVRCQQFCQEEKLVSYAHTPYPTKLISENLELENQIIASLINDLEIAEACGSLGVVVHFGTMKTGDLLEGYKKMISVLNSVLHQWNGNVQILIENNAGAGTNMGITLEEMVQIRKLTNEPEKIGFCFDTCHAYASGLWNGDNWDSLVEKGLELEYFQHLKVIHLNNSKYASGKRKDRHANLLNGFITETQLQEILHSPVLNNIPFILETPNDEEMHSHRDEIQLVKKWLN